MTGLALAFTFTLLYSPISQKNHAGKAELVDKQYRKAISAVDSLAY
jgi:hypothetical protein